MTTRFQTPPEGFEPDPNAFRATLRFDIHAASEREANQVLHFIAEYAFDQDEVDMLEAELENPDD